MRTRTQAIIITSSLILALGCRLEDASTNAVAQDVGGVERTLRAYETALNASDVQAIQSLYTADAVFMAQHHPPAEGLAAVEASYAGLLSAIDLDIRFTIDEVEVLGDTAWARTRSAGTTTVLGTEQVAQEGNQELFILHRRADRWKIHRYIFASTNPRP